MPYKDFDDLYEIFTEDLQDEISPKKFVKLIVGDNDNIRYDNAYSFNNVVTNVLPGNYKERFNERVVMQYGQLDDMDYKGLKKVFGDMKKAVGKIEGQPVETLDFRRIPKEYRESLMRSNIEKLYNTYFSYSSYTMKYSKNYEVNAEPLTRIAYQLSLEMAKNKGFSGVDTYKENLNIIRDEIGSDVVSLRDAIYMIMNSPNVGSMLAMSEYYDKRVKAESDDEEDTAFSDYQLMKLADTLVSYIESKKSHVRTPSKIVKTPKVR